LRLDPYFPEALNNLGFIEYTKGNYDDALNLYRQSLQIQPRSAVVFMNIAACLFATQNYDEGAATMRQALEIDPKLLQRGQGSGTLVQGNQPSDPMMQFHMAKLLATRGEADLAINYLSKAVDNGFKDAAAIRTDPAFSRLAMDERFTRLLEDLNRR
jgi:tetratricopeptide (TPR) repeat protein